MKKELSFVDANKNKVTVGITINDGKFSMSGDMGRSCGQIYDSIEPATESQKDLLDLWKKYHLNDMKAGTPRQMELVKGLPYVEACAVLERENLLEDILPDGKEYIYGSGWLTEELPEDIEDLVEEVAESIEEEEGERRGETLISDLDIEEAYSIIDDVSNDDPDEIYAICLLFELTANEIEDIAIEGNNRICVQGVDYLFGTDDEMDEQWEIELDNYLQEIIYPELSGHLQNYFDDEAWKRDAKYDGRAHSLNRYDGGEEYVEVKGVYYYAYRQ
jgi:hypothetical protein